MAKSKQKIYKTTGGEVVYGMMAEFADPAATYHAAEKMRDAGYKNWDVYAPFPIHGIDEAMGLKTSRVPLLCGILGLSGAGLGFLFQWWVSAKAYPMVVQGKPYGAWQPLMPIIFEFGVIFTSFTALLSMFAFNRLPMWYHPLLKKERFLRTSDDRFVICVEARDPKFDPEGTRKLLEQAGGRNVDLVED
jgi:hypothetical protein